MNRLLWIVPALLVCAAPLWAQDPTPKDPVPAVAPADLLLRESQPWDQPDVTPAAIQPLLAAAEKWLAEVQREPTSEAGGQPLKAPLENLVDGLKRLTAVLDRQARAAKLPDDLAQQVARVQADIERMLRDRPPVLVEGPLDSKSIEAAVAVVTALRTEEAAAQDALTKVADPIAAGPEQQKKATQQLTEARAALTAATPIGDLAGVARTAAQLRQQNIRLAVRLAEKQVEVLAAEVKAAQSWLPLRRAEHERARRRAEVHAAELAKLQVELKEDLERRRQSLDYQVQVGRQALELARAGGDPFAVLNAVQELWLAEHRLATHGDEEDLNQVRAQLQKEREFLKNEQVGFDNLRLILEKGGRRGRLVADRLYPMFQRVQKDLRRRGSDTLEHISRRLADLQVDRADLAAIDVGATLRAQFDPAAYALRPFPQARLQDEWAAAERVRAKALGERVLLLNNLAQEYTELEGISLEIDEHLRSKYEYILQRLFWIQEESPLGADALSDGLTQFAGVHQTVARAFTQDETAAEWLAGRAGGWLTRLGLIAAPGLIGFLRWRLRRSIRRDSTPATVPTAGRLSMLASGTVSALLWPAYLALLAFLAGLNASSESFAAGTAQALWCVAAGLALFFSGRVYFGRFGVFVGHFGLAPDACRGLQSLLCHSGILTTLLLAPALFLRHPGVGAPAAARLFYTAYEGLLALLLVWNLRKGSPTVVALFSGGDRPENGFLYGWWTFGHWVGAVSLAGIVTLDGFGYRYGARVISMNVLRSVATVLGVVLLYRVLLELVSRLDTAGRLLAATGAPPLPGGKPPEAPELVRARVEQSYRKFLRLVLGLAGAVIIALTWGLDAHVFRTLDTLVLIALHPESNIYLTVNDVVLAIAIALITWAVLANLDGVFEVLLFPYVGWDQGARYAALALTRYAVFFVGLVLGLSRVHVSLSSLQWILAAASVGIGFGLQEIIANFICGLILLLERPIRVGDIVTIGTTAGVIRKINIRSTTVANWNYESMIIPNREFIVGKVINWTHEDPVTRLVFTVRVPYGVDLDQARSILQRAVVEHPLVPREPASGVALNDFGENSVNFTVFLYAAQPDHRGVIQEEVLTRIYRDFHNAGITMPYPQRELHLKSLPAEWLATLQALVNRSAPAATAAPETPISPPAPDATPQRP